MKISFTGSRRGMSPSQKTNFEKVLTSSKASLFIHGDCIGADLDAHKIAHRLGLAINKRPCDIEVMRAWTIEGSYKIGRAHV